MARAATFDMAAISLSGLCLAHCLALPLAAASLPVLGVWAEAEWVHALFVVVAAPISLLALFRSSGRGPGGGAAILAVLGLAALTAGVIGRPAGVDETVVTVGGSLLLAAAHVLNWRRTRRPPAA